MASEDKAPVGLGGHWERVLYAFCGALGCFLGVWLGPKLTSWESASVPDPYGAIGGLGVGFILASFLNGFLAGLRSGSARK
jgi:hypothetical protein